MWDNDSEGGLRVLLVTRVSGLEEELANRALPGIVLQRTKEEPDTIKALADAEVVVADPVLVAHLLDNAPGLKWLQSTYAGVDALFTRCSRRDYVLTRMKGVFGPLMAEYTLGHILSRERYLPELFRYQQERKWKPARYRRLSELVLGILGMGDIGQDLARAAKVFGMKIWGLRNRRESLPHVDRLFTPDQLEEFLSGPDYLVNVLPSTPATRGFLSGESLKSCRSSAVFINIGRGDVIDESSLVRAIQEEWIAGAVLDVFPEEPLRPDSPLWALPGVTITPHVAAFGWAKDIADIIEANLAHYRSSEPLEHMVDWERGS